MSRFRMQLAGLKPATRYAGVGFTVSTSEGRVDPVLREACGEHMDYGHLFSYLFRRFGYPNIGWDDYKELACYLLTTPHPELVLRVVPYVGGNTEIHFSFLAPMALVRATEEWGERFRVAWEQRALDWAEKTGLPGWMSEWISFCNEDLSKHFKDFGVLTDKPFSNWRQTVPWMKSLAIGAPPSLCAHPIVKYAKDFSEQLYAKYRGIEAYPGYCERSANWRDWEADDPLKPLADAAFVALQDLRRPVRVRDCAIDAFGTADERSGRVLKEPSVAGYPSGDLGNRAPKAFAELHGLILRLGNDNAKRGIRKVIAGATRASRGPRP